MVSVKSGLVAGVIATLVTSAIVQMKNATGALPEVHLLNAWSTMLGEPTHASVGWIAFVFAGAVLGGIAFALLSPRLPTRSFAIKGGVFGILMWLVIMLVVMPLAGAGAFAMRQGTGVPAVATLVLYLIYGVVLGRLYLWGLDSDRPRAAADRSKTS